MYFKVQLLFYPMQFNSKFVYCFSGQKFGKKSLATIRMPMISTGTWQSSWESMAAWQPTPGTMISGQPHTDSWEKEYALCRKQAPPGLTYIFIVPFWDFCNLKVCLTLHFDGYCSIVQRQRMKLKHN